MDINYAQQPLIAPFRRKFGGPLDLDSEVQTYDDLLKMDVRICYAGMRVWVHDKRSTYYLAKVEPQNPEAWQEITMKTQILEWEVDKSYSKGDIVSLVKSGRLYRSMKNDNIGSNPVRYPRAWKAITGDVEEYKREFTNQSSVVITVPMEHPIFQVYQKQTIAGVEKMWAIDCLITETTETPNVLSTEDGQEELEDAAAEEEQIAVKKYKFEFFEDEKPVSIDGIILAK